MSFERLKRAPRVFGFRLAAWTSSIFILTTIPLVVLTHEFLSSSLEQRDRDVIAFEVNELSERYRAGGGAAVQGAILRQEQLGSAEPFLIRLITPAGPPGYVRFPERWRGFDLQRLESVGERSRVTWTSLPARQGDVRLEVASLGLPDGAVLQIAKTTEGRDEVLGRFRNAATGLIVPALFLSVCAGVFLASRTLGPLRRVIETVRAIERGAIHVRVPIRKTGDELDELGELFNEMLDRISALVDGMRNALDSVAHELRTPVTRIRGAAEVALRSEREAHGLQHALADCIEESDHLLVLLNTLMDISEAESGALTLKLETVDVARLVENVFDLYRHVADDKGITLDTAIPTGLHLTADRSCFRQVLANLVDNAIKYTGAGGHIDVKAEEQPSIVVMSVADNGIGLEPDEIPQVWDRLYRGSPGRSERGLGLGLSLVRAFVRAHGGDVAVVSTLGIGSTFTISLPRSPIPSR